MKNKLFPILFAIPVTAGICGAILLATEFGHVQEGILPSPSNTGVIIVSAIAILMALAISFLLKDGISFKKAGRALTIVSFIGAGVILLHGALLLLSLAETFKATTLILALFSVYSSVSFIVLGKYSLCERENTAYSLLSAVPSFWMCFLLILSFRDKVTEPIILNYIFLILSYISILLFCYSVAAHALGKDRKCVAVFSCFAGIFFILTELLSRLFSGAFSHVTATEITELLPLLAFLPIFPVYTAEIIRKKD